MASLRNESPNSQSATRTGTAPLDKQERIRNNQRRSRARRQEYLGDLERRLQECHSTCREAELQGAALAEMQHENACLRTLLIVTGVSRELVDSFLRQQSANGHRASDGLNTMRQLRPKLRVPHGSGAGAASTSTTTTPDAFNSLVSHNIAASAAKVTQSPSSALQYLWSASASPSALSAEMDDETSYMLQDPESDLDLSTFSPLNTTEAGDEYIDNSFLTPMQGSAFQDDQIASLTSIAQDFLDQYNVSTNAMGTIGSRVITQISQSHAPEAGRGVKN